MRDDEAGIVSGYSHEYLCDIQDWLRDLGEGAPAHTCSPVCEFQDSYHIERAYPPVIPTVRRVQ